MHVEDFCTCGQIVLADLPFILLSLVPFHPSTITSIVGKKDVSCCNIMGTQLMVMAACITVNWSSLPYFISSQETAFEMKFLNMYDTELLIGELSYKQKADIYNCYHGYEDLDQQSGNDMIRRYVYVTIFTLYITITWSELCFGY